MLRNFSFRRMFQGMGMLLLLAAVVVSGCSTLNNPVAPQIVQPSSSTISRDAFVAASLDPAPGTGVLTKPVSATTRVVADEGGQVRLAGRGYTYSLTFPPGALDEDTDITIQADDANILRVDLGPSGQTFDQPVTFQIRADNNFRFIRPIDQQTFDIYWYDNGEWVPQHATLVQHDRTFTATVELSHFSQYALGGQRGQKGR